MSTKFVENDYLTEEEQDEILFQEENDISDDYNKDSYNISINKLFDDNKQLVFTVINKSIPRNSFIYTDAIQAGMVGLWKASITFKPDKGFLFQTYARACIKNEFNLLYRKFYGKKGGPRYKYEHNKVFLDDKINSENTNSDMEKITFANSRDLSYTEDFEIKIGYNRIYHMIEYFNEKDKTIFLLKEKGYIVTEIANILGYKQPFISKRLSVVYDYLKIMVNIDTFTEHEMKNLVLDLYKKCKRKSENKLWVVTKDFSSIYGLEYPIAKLLANKWISEIEK